MTVKELIEKLQVAPENADVSILYYGSYNFPKESLVDVLEEIDIIHINGEVNVYLKNFKDKE